VRLPQSENSSGAGNGWNQGSTAMDGTDTR